MCDFMDIINLPIKTFSKAWKWHQLDFGPTFTHFYLLKNSKNYRSGVIHNITHSNPTLFQSYTLPFLHSSNPTLFQSYTLPILHPSNPTPFQSYTLPILHFSNLTLGSTHL